MNRVTPVTEKDSLEESGIENLFQLFGVLYEIDRENQLASAKQSD